MTEATLNSLMKLFAILANLNKEASGILSRNFVESFLKIQFSNRLIEHALSIFDIQFEKFAKYTAKSETKRTSLLSVQIIYLCGQINNELPIKDRYLILFSLIRFSKFFEELSSSELEFHQTVNDAVRAISDGLHIEPLEYENCKLFLYGQFYKIPDREKLLVVSNERDFPFTRVNHLQNNNLKGQLFFLKIDQANLLIFFYSGSEKLELNGKIIFSDHIYILPRGSAIRGHNTQTVYFNAIESAFLKKKITQKTCLLADNIRYTFPNSSNGIHNLSFAIESGEFVGIMGGSGAGKSTLMNMLNGRLEIKEGDVLINGHSIFSEKKHLKRIIGYVPQEDLLITDLTVFQNLYYSSLLSLGNISEKEVQNLVNRILNRLDLFHIKDLRVGSVMDKQISGGQRKRLNIALELIREPHILFSDEPTSGLSSTDSENVIELLKEQASQGKIVVVNIHQPSSGIFKMFDKIIIIDQGGYPVYTGNPLNAFSYLKNVVNRADKEEIECETCGNIQTRDILKIIESKKVNEYGEYTRERSLKPSDWYQFYKENEKPLNIENINDSIPPLYYSKPSKWKQFIIYSTRNFLSKIADRQFVLLAMIIPPLLALILGYFTKYVTAIGENDTSYIFSANENIPAYIFMSVIVALFVGLIISAEEIIKDRPILIRESYLNLSRFAYLNAKILFLFFLSALQMMIFVFLGNSILEIRSLYFEYWLVLFSTASFAVLLGLNISSGLKSLIAVYINIPFILVPLILLAGVIVNYDKLHYKVASAHYVPLVGDLMASRWAYEALVVNQFLNNDYQTHFNHIDKEKYNLNYEVNFLIPELINKIDDYEGYYKDNNEVQANKTYQVIRNSLSSLSEMPENLATLSEIADMQNLKRYLARRKTIMAGRIQQLNYETDQIINNMMENGLSQEEIIALKQDNQNESIRDIALNSRDLRKILLIDGRLVRKDAPVYQNPISNTGRAQFYAGNKKIFNLEIDTLWFNIFVIWLMILILYICLYNESLRKTIELIHRIKLNRIWKYFGFHK